MSGASRVNVAADYLVDLALGGAGAEVPILTDVVLGTRATTEGQSTGRMLYLPLAVPAGVRLAARCQSSTGGATIALGALGRARGVLRAGRRGRARGRGGA